MIAQPSATPETMLGAIAYTLAALSASAELDVDRSDADRQFFNDERDDLQKHFDTLFSADQAVRMHLLLQSKAHQARVVIGDAVLDRGVRTGKARMKLELKNTAPDGADTVFPANVRDITDAEQRTEPSLVLKAVANFSKVPDFNGKAALAADLEARATQQASNFSGRDAADLVKTQLTAASDNAVVAGSDALYLLEKHLLERFKRDNTYVRAFFLDVSSPRKKPGPAEADPKEEKPKEPQAPAKDEKKKG